MQVILIKKNQDLLIGTVTDDIQKAWMQNQLYLTLTDCTMVLFIPVPIGSNLNPRQPAGFGVQAVFNLVTREPHTIYMPCDFYAILKPTDNFYIRYKSMIEEMDKQAKQTAKIIGHS